MRLFSMLISTVMLSLGSVVGAQELPALGADPARISVSGLSSGAFMAVQYSVAWSSEVMGVGVVAGGPYNCAPPNGAAFISVCMQGKPPAERSWKSAQDFARDGVIDPVAGIAKQRVYLFSGTQDSVVAPSVMAAVQAFYIKAKVAPDALAVINTMPAGHAFLSAEIGDPCSENGGIYVVKCALGTALYDQPGAILNHLYGLKFKAAATLSATPIAFDQGRYGGDSALMATKGHAYVPAACRASGARCAVHVVFHGCKQSADAIGSDAIYAKLGYNRWADSNGIVVLYPQVDASATNPMGCWDWWGYSGLNFQLRHGPQIDAVHQMVARLLRAN